MNTVKCADCGGYNIVTDARPNKTIEEIFPIGSLAEIDLGKNYIWEEKKYVEADPMPIDLNWGVTTSLFLYPDPTGSKVIVRSGDIVKILSGPKLGTDRSSSYIFKVEDMGGNIFHINCDYIRGSDGR